MVNTAGVAVEHGHLTFWVDLIFRGSGQAFGGFLLRKVGPDEMRTTTDELLLTMSEKSRDLVGRVLKVLGLERFEGAAGRPLYAIRASSNWGAPIVAIANLQGDLFDKDAFDREWYERDEKRKAKLVQENAEARAMVERSVECDRLIRDLTVERDRLKSRFATLVSKVELDD